MQSLNAINQFASVLLSQPNAGAVIVYEDFSTGLKAKKLFDQFLNPHHPAGQYSVLMWEFAGFRSQPLRERAVRDAIASDLVCVSARADAVLPAGVKAWAETWASQRGNRHCTMVVLLGTCDAEWAVETAMIQFLRTVSRKANADFLVAPLEPFGELENSPSYETLARI